ncbi:uncharacterized protein LOC124374067 [Homalodisca vitripennis]|uniref:uncharacterized protein LOC124374067 n=1 Tax=Homalodisca vitripennis TaxID=197043 RepID=UPI001EE9B114|nr:uncharacterized protein LOC124374067 [Homalodisca vitripennis]
MDQMQGNLLPSTRSPWQTEQISDGEAAEQISTVDISEVTPLSDNLQGRNAPTTPPEERKDTDGWMSLPTDIPMSCPPGLEYLYYTDPSYIFIRIWNMGRTIPQRYSPKDWLDLDDDEVGVSKPGPRNQRSHGITSKTNRSPNG